MSLKRFIQFAVAVLVGIAMGKPIVDSVHTAIHDVVQTSQPAAE